MSKLEFIALCGELLIEPGIALENTHVTEALAARRPAAEVREILQTEF